MMGLAPDLPLTPHPPFSPPALQPAKAGSLFYGRRDEGLLRLAFKFEHKVERVPFACAAFSRGASWRGFEARFDGRVTVVWEGLGKHLPDHLLDGFIYDWKLGGSVLAMVALRVS